MNMDFPSIYLGFLNIFSEMFCDFQCREILYIFPYIYP